MRRQRPQGGRSPGPEGKEMQQETVAEGGRGSEGWGGLSRHALEEAAGEVQVLDLNNSPVL